MNSRRGSGPLRWLHDPIVMRRFHLGATLTWVLLVVPTLLWWRESVLWVALMSAWANIAAHWGAYQATRAEEAQHDG